MIKILRELLLSAIINAVILRRLDANNFGIAIDIQSTDILRGFLILGFILWIFNFLIKKILRIVTFPLWILTLGLIGVLINIAVLYAFAWFVNTNIADISIQLGGYMQTLILSIVISLAYYLLSKILKQ